MTRKPGFAGSFYSDDKKSLLNEIEQSFLGELGVKTIRFKKNNQKIKAVIVPHAGYYYSGQCASHAYKLLAESKKPKTYILLGPSHRYNYSSISDEDWQTPLGTLKTNNELAKKISKHTKIPLNNESQHHEHSIEVQLPFIQYITQNETIKPEIICVMISQDIELESAMKKFAETIKEEDITFIISSDFTHYGKNFNYTPFIKDVQINNIQKSIANQDLDAIEKIIKLDPKNFIDYINKTKITICGATPIYCLLLLFENLGLKPETHLLKYYSSTELTHDPSSSVSYASISFK